MANFRSALSLALQGEQLHLSFRHSPIAGTIMNFTFKIVVAVHIFTAGIAGSAMAGPSEEAEAAYERCNYVTATRLLRPLVDLGDTVTQNSFRGMYRSSLGAPQNYAVSWYRKVANQCNPCARHGLGPYHALAFCDLDNRRIRRLNLRSNLIAAIVSNGQEPYFGDGRFSTVGALSINGSYSTNFTNTEDPISEAGAWHHLSTYETVVKTEMINGAHVAHGTQVGGAYDDSSAYLSGFTANQSAEGVIWKRPGISTVPNREVEILLRWEDGLPPRNTKYGMSAADGYEININQNGDYLQLGRFKGPMLMQAAVVPKPATGDLFKATAIDNRRGGTVITVFWNGVQVMQYIDAAPKPIGNPGMGFYIDSGAANNEFGFSRFTANSLSSNN
jgi:hypothetical protein